jgi:subtilisin family serine protease
VANLRATILIVGCAFFLFSGCGKDEPDFEDLKGEIGPVPGNYNVRLAPNYREQVDGLKDKLNAAIPGVGAQLDQRFAGEEGAAGEGVKLSDLLKVNVPGTTSDAINSRIMGELTALGGEDDPYFSVVDTEKYLNTPTYETTEVSGEQGKYQYYLDMIRWHLAVKSMEPASMPNTAPIVVAVLDTGVLATHEDLTNVMWQNSSGAVGYDASTKKPMAKDTSSDGNGHGTHVAGIIGAQGNNAVGINGVGYVSGRGNNAVQSITEIMAVKVMNDNGSGTSEMVSDGLKWAVDQHRKQKTGARAKQKLIVNMSLGGPFETNGYSYKKNSDGTYDFQDDIINYATANKDVLIVVAAGNESCGIGGACDLYGESYKETYYYPCSYANVLCVAATSTKDTLAGFSNRLASVGISAPGFDIVSTLPTAKNAYGYMSGTSMATPVTAGAAAVLWYMYPDFDSDQIKLILEKSSARIAEITGQINSGYGRLDLKAAMDYAEQLKTAGKGPATFEPKAGTVQTAKVTVDSDAVPPTNSDPDATSENATGSSTKNKGNGSANGCAVIGSGRSQSPLQNPLQNLCALMLLGLVIFIPSFSSTFFLQKKRMRKT